MRIGRTSWSRFYRLMVAFNLAACAALGLSRPDLIADMRNSAFDRFQRLAPARFDPDAPVRVAAVDERSLAELGQWPWPRTRLAELTDKLRELGAAAIGFDVIFAESDRLSPDSVVSLLPKSAETEALARRFAQEQGNDARFAAALAKAPSVIGLSFLSRDGGATDLPVKAGFAITGDDPKPFLPAFAGIAAPLPALAAAAGGLGAINWIPDHDQVVRRVPLVVRLGDRLFPALSLESLRLAFGASTILIRASNASGQTDFGAQTGVSALRVGDIAIPTDSNGAIRPRFSPSDSRRMISIAAILRGETPDDAVRGRIILIGPTAAGLGDIKATPLDAAAPGVEIHAQIIEQVLSGGLLTRPDWSPGAELIATLALTLAMAVALPLMSPLAGGATGLLVVSGLLAGSFLAFVKAGLLLDPVQPSLAVGWQTLTGLLALWRSEITARRQIQTAFGKYLSPHVVARLADHPERLALGGETRELTIMFSDLRDFTKLSEGLDAQDVTRLMNSYLTPMTEAILAAEGTVDKYIGDAIMAFWNAPLDVADHPRRAVGAALAMRAALEQLNRTRSKQDRALPILRMGVGLNLGLCSVGNMGSTTRFDYSALGDNVNLSSRLEGASKAYGVDILAAGSVAERAPDQAWLDLDFLIVKGRSAPTRVHALAGDDVFAATPHFKRWKAAHDDIIAAFRAGDFSSAAKGSERLMEQATPEWRPLYRFLNARFAALAAEGRAVRPGALLALDAK